MATFGSIKEGEMVKCGGAHKSWKKRFFILNDVVIYYFGKEKDMKSKGSILYSAILRLEEVTPQDPKRPHCFNVVTGERTYVMQAKTQHEMEDWMRAVQALSTLHQNRDTYRRTEPESCTIADDFKHRLITLAKSVVKQVVTLSGMFKNIARSPTAAVDKAAKTQIEVELNGMGKATVQLAGCTLDVLNHVFDAQATRTMMGCGAYLRGLVGHLVKFAKGTPNEAATEYACRQLLAELDKLPQMELPNVKTETNNMIQALVLRAIRFQDCNMAAQVQELADKLAAGAADFLASCSFIANSMTDATLKARLMGSAARVPDLIDRLRNAVKQAVLFRRNDDTNQSDIAALKASLREALLEVMQSVDHAFASAEEENSALVAAEAQDDDDDLFLDGARKTTVPKVHRQATVVLQDISF